MQLKLPQPNDRCVAKLDDVVGYLNFSSGVSDAKFMKNLDALYRAIDRATTDVASAEVLHGWLTDAVKRLGSGGGAFADVTQATATIRILFEHLLPAYRSFHRDLLHHQTDEELWRPYFIGRAAEAILLTGGPWDETERIVEVVLARLNDYVGYRPTAVLAQGTQCEPYRHELVRPIPLFLRGAGVAAGKYERILALALEILRDASDDILALAWFDFERLEEIALDPRAYDFDHPVNRRPNHHFGQWDPRQISDDGFYARFVLQQVTLDALLTWCRPHESLSLDDAYFQAAAVLAGTILMASGTSGDGPARHDSNVTLSTLLPHIAAYRDEFYREILAKTTGPRGEMLRAEAERHHQPLGGARQHLNQELARRRALQLQRVHLALLYARMGFESSALKQAGLVRVAAARMLTAIYCRLTSGHDALDRDELAPVVENLEQIEALLHRAIECGALVDPWNVVGFAANFSLFPALENTVHDWRVDELIELVEQILDLAARSWSEAAAVDDRTLEERFSSTLDRIATWWDQYATASVEGVKHLVAKEIEVSANLVAGALNAWHKAGAASGDVGFWRMFVDQFDSSKSFQPVIEALLDHGDAVASAALMMQWVNQCDRTPLEQGDVSFHRLAFRWLATVEAQQENTGEDCWPQIEKFFAFLEANAEEYWQAPTTMAYEQYDVPFEEGDDGDLLLDDDDDADDADDADDDEEAYEYEYEYDEDELDLDDDYEELFGAAYDDVVYRDSTDDGVESELFDDGTEQPHSQWEALARYLDQRLAFLTTVARLWKHAAITCGGGDVAERRESFDQWLAQADANYRRLIELLEAVRRHRFRQPTGSHESLVEFDRLRTLKESLVQRIISTCVETATAARLLMATRTNSRVKAKAFDKPVDEAAILLLRALLAGDPSGAQAVWEQFLAALRPLPLLYLPYSRGGEPQKIVVTRSVQRLLRDLLEWLPKLGLIRETCQLLDLAQQLEHEHPIGQGAVTEFDRLFEIGYKAVVRCVIASSECWTDDPAGDEAQNADHLLVEILQQLTERQLDRWLAHSRTLQLSVTERLALQPNWQRFVQFIRQYGDELFSQRFLSLGNLRGILHQGVDAWLANLENDEAAADELKLLDDLTGETRRKEAVEMLTIAIESIVENYRAYRDYNTTTTQSDHGQQLYTFVDFIRLRAAYDRVAWNLKPVVWAHEILVRHHCDSAAEMWRRAFTERTSDVADSHAAKFVELSQQYGMQLCTVADRINERFVRPLVIDRVRALIAPSMSGTSEERRASFASLESEISELVDEPHGAGLDVPDWLAALEDEVTEARSRMSHVSSSDRLAKRIGQVELPWKDISEQLSDDSTAEEAS